MKPVTEQDYRKRVLRVVEHIDRHLDEPLRLEDLAEVAHFSPCHFHRIFRGLVGETLGDYIRRRRLAEAARGLRNGASVLEVALGTGYESPESFARAFKAVFGVVPSRFRERDQVSDTAPPGSNLLRGPDGVLLILPSSLRRLNMQVDIVTLETAPIAFLKHTGPYDDIGPLFERIIGWAVVNGHMVPDALVLGRYYDDPESVPADRLRSEACVSVSDAAAVEDGIETGTLRGGTYAKTRFKGPYTDLKQVYDFIYGAWLPHSGRETEDAPCIEVYINNPGDTRPDDLLTDIYVPLKA